MFLENITDEWLEANGHDRQWLADWLAEPCINEDAVKEWFRVHRDSDPRLLIVYPQDVDSSRSYQEIFLPRKKKPWRRQYIRRKKARRATPYPSSKRQIDERMALFGHQCAYCGNNGKITIDHVVALSRGGLDAAVNIIPACVKCNSSKNARAVEKWYKSQDFFNEARWLMIQSHCSEDLTQA